MATYDSSKPADNQTIAQGPADIRQNFDGVVNGQVVDAKTTKGLVPGNASGNIPVSNGTLNTNLNSEMLGGLKSAAYALAGHTHSVATTSSAGFESATDKTKLNGIASGAQVNQNAWANFVAGSTTAQADSVSDTFTFVAGTNIALTMDGTNDKMTISFTGTAGSATSDSDGNPINTTYLKKTDASSTYLSKTNAASTYLTQSNASSTYLSKTDASSTYLGQTSAANTYLTQTNAASTYLTKATAASTYALTGHTHTAATESAAGFLSTADKTKLDGIASGAEVNQNAFSIVTVGSSSATASAEQDTLILVPGTNIAITLDTTNKKATFAVTGTVASAAQLATGRTIALSGGATGTATTFNGTANIIIPVTSLDATKLSGTASISTTGNAATATKATGDSDGNNIKSTYLKQTDAASTYLASGTSNYTKSVSASGGTLTVTNGAGTASTYSIGNVKTVNGVSPDSSGNVPIPDMSSQATEIAQLQSFFNGTATRTLLAGSESSSGIGSGNITLASSWKDFDALLVIRANDSSKNLSSDIVYVWQFQQLLNLATNLSTTFSLGTGTQGYYWYLTTASTELSLVNAAENCCVQAIYGIKMTGTGITNNTAMDVTTLQANYSSMITSDGHMILPSGLEVW